jgi:hypothetical protein
MVILYSMKRPIFVRPVSDAERKTLEAGLRTQRMPSPCAALPDTARQQQGQECLPDRSGVGLQCANGAQRHPCLQREGAPGSTSAGFEASAHRSHGLRCWAGRGLARDASPSRPSPCCAANASCAHHPWFHVRRLEVHSRFPTIEAPDKVAEAIERFVTQEVSG